MRVNLEKNDYLFIDKRIIVTKYKIQVYYLYIAF